MNKVLIKSQGPWIIWLFFSFFSLYAKVSPLGHHFILEPGLGEIVVLYKGELPFLPEESITTLSLPLIEKAHSLEWIGVDGSKAVIHQGVLLNIAKANLEKLESISLQYRVPAPKGKATLRLMNSQILQGPGQIIFPRYRSMLRNSFDRLGILSQSNIWPPRLVKTWPNHFIKKEQINSSKYDERQKVFPANMKPLTYDFDLIKLEKTVNEFPEITIHGILPSRDYGFWLVMAFVCLFALIGFYMAKTTMLSSTLLDRDS
jgi:hypothetical protein